MIAKRILTKSLHVEEIHRGITSQHIKAALLAQSNLIDTHTCNPLEHLALVDQVVCDSAFPQSLYGRALVLADILYALITTELSRHRLTMEIPDTPSETTISDVFQAIIRDQQTFNRELLGWSWLYYGYVRVDLCLQAKAFARICHIEERTLRRYQECALTRLTHILIKREWQVRRGGISIVMNNSSVNPKGIRHWTANE